MHLINRLIVLGLAVLGLAFAGCAQSAAAGPTEPPPANVEPIAGSDLAQITLSDAAVDRVGIKTAPVVAGDAGQTAIPAAAVLYDVNGAAWVYTNLSGHVYQRAPITVVSIKGDTATVSSGPAAGTQVVIVGVAELFGTETGVGDPEQ
jgi:hypothetical protein